MLFRPGGRLRRGRRFNVALVAVLGLQRVLLSRTAADVEVRLHLVEVLLEVQLHGKGNVAGGTVGGTGCACAGSGVRTPGEVTS